MNDETPVETRLTKKELLDMLSEHVKAFERLPQHAMMTPITHYDLSSFLILVLAILRADD